MVRSARSDTSYSANTDDLRQFVENGERLVDQLDRIFADLEDNRSRCRVLFRDAAFGDLTPVSSGPLCADLVGQFASSNRFVGGIETSLRTPNATNSVSSIIMPPWSLIGPTARLAGEAVNRLPAVIDKTERAADRAWAEFEQAKGRLWEMVKAATDPLDDALVSTVPHLAAVGEMSLRVQLGPLYPVAADFFNRTVGPRTVQRVWSMLDLVIPDRPSNGDAGGTFTHRSSGYRNSDNRGSWSEIGRRAVVQAFVDTADGDVIYQDEFQLVSHAGGRYTVVLPGVVDLTSPTRGFDSDHHSARDTDAVAARSASSARIADNLYASLVVEALEKAELPPGANLMIVGHSLGADTALDLAADPVFNGSRYNITHVVAAAYHSEPQLPHLQPGTNVLVLQNNKDIPVLVENLGHLSDNPLDEISRPPPGVLIREFDGGWKGAGHHQDNYTSYLIEVEDHGLERFFRSVAQAGYGRKGPADAIDISNPYIDERFLG